MTEGDWYRAAMLAGFALGALVWVWLRGRRDPAMPPVPLKRLLWIALGGVGGAAAGSKLAFLLAEGWRHAGDSLALASGQSITGALLGGYLGVEVAKRAIRHAGPTGDWFAIGAPLGVAFGRLGCHARGCCAGVAVEPHALAWADAGGVHRWPAQSAELVFNVLFAAFAALCTVRGWFPGNRFHLYLIAYGLFRATHELVRTNAPLLHIPAGPITGYTLIAVAMAAFGAVRFRQRRRGLSAAVV